MDFITKTEQCECIVSSGRLCACQKHHDHKYCLPTTLDSKEHKQPCHCDECLDGLPYNQNKDEITVNRAGEHGPIPVACPSGCSPVKGEVRRVAYQMGAAETRKAVIAEVLEIIAIEPSALIPRTKEHLEAYRRKLEIRNEFRAELRGKLRKVLNG